ncbi:MAG: cob(I)yrinic acid a,c-diamide adenosyltransferase [Anaerolineae bacterium]|nr:cob(I)yrinic acid a,c-diamide adenosyltransferase [Anaerolineae bacterium]
MKIYTRTGDDGSTALFAGGRVPKHHLRVECYGTADELNSALGLARALQPLALTDERLHTVQRQLFNLGADLATPLEAPTNYTVRVLAEDVAWLEAEIDVMTAGLPELRSFILPGGTPAAAQIHAARTICRRAERLCTSLAEHEALNPQAIPYLNRLSDFLFTLARWENQQSGVEDERWTVR